MNDGLIEYFWNLSQKDIFSQLNSEMNGLSNEEAERRLSQYGLNTVKDKHSAKTFTLFILQFTNPIILILIFAAIVSIFLHDPTDAAIILSIIFISGMLGFWQEKGASNAVQKLLEIVQIKSIVFRSGEKKETNIENIVPGDIISVSAGNIIPGDSYLLEANNLFLDEATLTGETFPMEKLPGIIDKDTILGNRSNLLFMGTHVVSGSGKAIIVNTGKRTEFGKVSVRLQLKPTETEFEKGIRKFGYLLLEVTLILIFIIFAFNAYFQKSIIESFLFSMALAVGLTPQLLPAIISINLSHGARRMAEKKVIVKKLSAIENFGGMNVLCSDKTGTLTEGKVKVKEVIDLNGKVNEKAFLYAYLNASFQSGFENPIDKAITEVVNYDLNSYKKIGEIPYDFIRKRLSIHIKHHDQNVLITKGALQNVLSICSHTEIENKIEPVQQYKETINKLYNDRSADGFRVLGIAYKILNKDEKLTREDEADMIFLGFLLLFDPPKKGIIQTIQKLSDLGVSLKIITGDNKFVAESISKQIGLVNPQIISGSNIRLMSNEALLNAVNKIDVFAEVEPNQKERIILALKKSGNVVGYMGDGINDASALHSADVGISVESAVDVAKESADIVLLETDLNVLINGVNEGRKTFANTMKYIFMATSANFGNMFSMAGVSLILPFLPLLPKQILLTNLLTDFPEITIASDSVDEQLLEKPHR